MNEVYITRSDEYLMHYGVKGMKWGVRHDPERVGHKRERRSSSKTNKQKKNRGLSDKTKRRLIAGAAIVGTALAAYGAYKLGKSGALTDLVHLGKGKLGKLKFTTNVTGSTNPGNYRNNCKDVAEATLKRWLGVDASAVAGPNSVKGNLHDFVRAKGYNPKGVKWLGDTGSVTAHSSGDSTFRVTKQLLRKYKDGDCGMITVPWRKEVRITPNDDGHAFNWFIQNGAVKFFDDQGDAGYNASRWLKYTEPGKEIEICQITKEAFNRR